MYDIPAKARTLVDTKKSSYAAGNTSDHAAPSGPAAWPSDVTQYALGNNPTRNCEFAVSLVNFGLECSLHDHGIAVR
jgi:hypothetical protein